MTVYKWSQTPSNNDTADATVNAREGMAPSQVNDSMRAMMAAVAKWRDDASGKGLTGGTSTAYTLTSNQGFTALTSGLVVSARVHVTSGAAPTLNVDSLGAKPIARSYGTAIPTGKLKLNHIYTFIYDATDVKWIVLSGGDEEFATGDTPLFFQAAAPLGYTKQTTHTDKGIRIVSGSGGGSGGTRSFSTTFTGRTILQANLPAYTLPDTFAIANHAGQAQNVGIKYNFITWSAGAYPAVFLESSGLGTSGNLVADAPAALTHALTGSVTSGGSGTAMDFALQYIDVLACAKD